MTKQSSNRPQQALISPARGNEEPLRQHRAVQIAALFAAAPFMENLDSTVIVTALPQMTLSFGVTPTRSLGRRHFAATVALDLIDAPHWSTPWSAATGCLSPALEEILRAPVSIDDSCYGAALRTGNCCRLCCATTQPRPRN
jgi:hypothetical protein